MADNITSVELEAALDKVEEFMALPRQIEDDDITAPRLAKRLGKRSQNLNRTLELMVEQGKLKFEGKVQSEDGRLVKAYKLVKG